MADKRKSDTAFVLMIFCIFACSVLLTLTYGGSAYGSIIDISAEGRNEKIALSYVRTKIRNADMANSISTAEINGVSVLMIEETLEDRKYITYIYAHDGWVHEFFTEKGLNEFAPENGVRIIEAGCLVTEALPNGLILVSTNYGSIMVYPRSGLVQSTQGGL